MLDDPEGYIIGRGGAIVVALQKDRPVGVCALVPWHGKDAAYDYELAKMAVAPNPGVWELVLFLHTDFPVRCAFQNIHPGIVGVFKNFERDGFVIGKRQFFYDQSVDKFR